MELLKKLMESQVLQYMLGMLVVAVLNKHDIALAV
jgi:hypothetical protein